LTSTIRLNQDLIFLKFEEFYKVDQTLKEIYFFKCNLLLCDLQYQDGSLNSP